METGGLLVVMVQKRTDQDFIGTETYSAILRLLQHWTVFGLKASHATVMLFNDLPAMYASGFVCQVDPSLPMPPSNNINGSIVSTPSAIAVNVISFLSYAVLGQV
uniref:Uncharacterized protein n=1 Tax=Romanomermis culicivorax TaxID=13658 RepID=A0A915IVM4_ROMCU